MAAMRSERRVMSHLNRLIANKQLTKNGKDWLVVATDPFHDTEATCEGYPDVVSSRTIVQCVTQTINVETPLSNDDNWDCHVFLFPSTPSWDQGNGVDVLPGAFYQTTVSVDGSSTEISQLSLLPIYAGYNVISCTNGADWTTATTTNGSSTHAVAWPTTFGAGQVRLISAGFEVVNTTAEINKQGSVTSYRSPATTSPGLFDLAAEPSQRPVYIEWKALPPTTQPEAALFPSSKTWAAADGIYSIATMDTTQNPFRSPIPSWSGMIQTPTQSSLTAGDPRLAYTPAWKFSTEFDYVAGPNCHAIDFDSHGCVFAGLSTGTTLQVTTRYFFERIPDQSDPNLLVLCKPSPAYDPLALEIYSHACSELPIAVKVDENPLGEWFEEVMNVVSSALPAIGGFLPIPGGSAIGSALGVGAKQLASANKKAREAKNEANVAKQKVNKLQKTVNKVAAARVAPNRRPPPVPKRGPAYAKKVNALRRARS